MTLTQFRLRVCLQFRVNIAYNLWGWGYPLLNLLIGAGMGVLGNGNNGIPYCLITDSDISWGIFYAPIGVMSCIGAAAMAMIIYAIAKVYSTVVSRLLEMA